MDLVSNGGFEYGDCSSWTKTDAQNASVVYYNRWSGDTTGNQGESATKFYGLRLGGTTSADGVTQTLTGLSPNTAYNYTAWMRSPNGETAVMGVKAYGSSEISATSTSGTWTEETLTFTTGPTNTSATIYLKKASSGSNYIYCDDASVQKSSQQPLFSDSFENGFGNWTTDCGTPSTSTAQKHSGSYSYILDEDLDAIIHSMGANTNKVASVWFYDDASNRTSVEALAFVDDNTTAVGIGVDISTSADKYMYRIGYTQTATNINRTTGWHQFVFDYISGNDVKLYIDGTLIATSTAATYFNKIKLGDPWRTGRTGNVYFDDVGVFNEIPPFFNDGFENGFGNWTAVYGTPSTSTAQKHSGNTSYILDEDSDIISHSMDFYMNKVCSVWFYDNSSDTTQETMAFVGDNVTAIGLGIDTSISTSNYIYRIGGAKTASSIARTTGWHQFVYDYRSGTGVTLYIDGVQVATSTAVTSFNIITLADYWVDGNVGNNYFDDVTVQNDIPPLFRDSFENGFDNWTTIDGTPRTSTVQKHSGCNSYAVNEDLDVIGHTMSSDMNKVGVVWFYDDASDTTQQTMAFVYDNVTAIGLGIDTSVSTSKYIYRFGGIETASSITRTTGWHKFAYDYRSGTGVTLYIDGTQVAASTAATSFNRITLGDYWHEGNIGNNYFDDISVQANLP